MVSVVLIGIWVALVIFQIYKWMFHKPPNFPPGKFLNYFLKLILKAMFILEKCSRNM